ncbi:MAG: four helix bundle protein [Salibacteraceae bacterium]
MGFEFQKLTVYQKAKEFHAIIADEVLGQDQLKRYHKDQLGRASFSVILNIAEGSSRFTNPSRKNYMVIARGSLFECVAALEILSDQELIANSIYEGLLTKADELSRILFSMIRNLEK